MKNKIKQEKQATVAICFTKLMNVLIFSFVGFAKDFVCRCFVELLR